MNLECQNLDQIQWFFNFWNDSAASTVLNDFGRLENSNKTVNKSALVDIRLVRVSCHEDFLRRFMRTNFIVSFRCYNKLEIVRKMKWMSFNLQVTQHNHIIRTCRSRSNESKIKSVVSLMAFYFTKSWKIRCGRKNRKKYDGNPNVYKKNRQKPSRKQLILL